MTFQDKPQQFWCPDYKEEHWATVLGGKIEISTSTALVKQTDFAKVAIDIRNKEGLRTARLTNYTTV